MVQPMIVKSSGGFYYVDTGKEIVECRARGLFRKDDITPYVGDYVKWEKTDNNKGFITNILDRKNFLIRPPVANIDVLVMVVSTVDPLPNLLIIDKLLAVAEYKNISPIIVITKNDLAVSDIAALYSKVGYTVVSGETTQQRAEMLKPILKNKLCVFTGNSGVGKSTLLNALDSKLCIVTAETSKKLGRGKHTTRTTEIYKVCGALIADTPGFSSLETIQLERILKENLQHCFVEFAEYSNKCKFTGCSHTKEKGCAIINAVEQGYICQQRHQSYISMYTDAKNIKEWEIAK